jgi:hypothetical protein
MMLALADPTEQAPVLRVSTKYMETFQPQQPVSGGSDISTYLNTRGELDLYSVGSSNDVNRIRLDGGGRASYSVQPLGIRARQLSLYTTVEQSPDNPNIFGVNDDGKLTLSIYNASKGGYEQKVTQPPSATAKLRNFLAVKGFSNVYTNVILDDGRLASNFYTPQGEWGGPNWVPTKTEAGADVKAISIAMCSNNPVQTALFAISDTNDLLFGEESYRYSKMKVLSKKGQKILHVAVVVDKGNLLHIFAVDTLHTLWLKRQKKYSSGPDIEFEDWVQLDSTVPLNRVFATLRFDGLLEVYAIGTDEKLYRTYQLTDAAGKPNGKWATLFPLGNPIGNSIFTVGRDRKGFAQVFSVTHDARIFQFWQSLETTQWMTQEITNAEMAKLVSTPTHACEITVLDEDGIPQPDIDITVSSSYLVSLRINGLSYQSSPVDRVTCRTDAAGKVVVYQQAVALAAATLFVETPFTLSGQPAEVEPNGQLQAKLHAMTEQEVLDAKDRKGDYLLPPNFRKPENAKSIAEITRSSMSLGLQGQTVGAIRFHYRSGVRGHRAPGRRINFDLVDKQSWSINFENGFPQYESLSAPAAAAWVQSRTDAGFEFLGVDWGDVWNSIKKGFEWVVNGLKAIAVWFDELGKKINVFFHMIIDGVEKIFETVLEYVQQAFDFIEGVWNYIKVGLEKLWEWLAFLFNLEDFKRTAEAIEHTFVVLTDYTVLATKYVKKAIDEGITSLKDKIKTSVDDFLKILDGSSTVGNFGDQYKEARPDLEQSSDHNLFLNAYMENGRDTKVLESTVASALDPLKIIAEKLDELSNNFEFGDGKKAFDEALGYFTNVGGNKNNAMTLLISGFIKIFEAIALFALDAARGVLLTIMDLIADVIEAFKSLLTEEWEIPIVSQLYKLFTGSDLTFRPISLLGYFVGIPATIFYKIATGETMFTAASLKNFKETFTAEWLANESGIGPTRTVNAPRRLSVADQAQLAYYFRTFAACTVTGRLVTDITQAIVNASGPETWRGLNIACVGLRYLTTGFSTPWALDANAGGLSCVAGAKGFSNMTWLVQIICGPTRGAVIIAMAPILKDKAKIVAEVTLSLWGTAHIIMDTVDFVKQSTQDRNPASYAAKMLLNLPGQTLRFLALDKLNPPETFYIPVGVLVVCIVIGYGGMILITAPMGAPMQQALHA